MRQKIVLHIVFITSFCIRCTSVLFCSCRKPHKPDEKWPLYSRSSPHYYTFTADGTSGPAGPRGPRASACAFWNDFLNKLSGNKLSFILIVNIYQSFSLQYNSIFHYINKKIIFIYLFIKSTFLLTKEKENFKHVLR